MSLILLNRNLNDKSIASGYIYKIESFSNLLVGTPVYYDGTSIQKADGSSAQKDMQFIISRKIQKTAGGYVYYITTNGIVTLSDLEWQGVLGGVSLVPGSRYYVSSSVPGTYTLNAPSYTSNLSTPPLVALSTTEAFVYTNSMTQIISTLTNQISNLVGTPVGTIIESASKTTPVGFLLCDGTAYLRSLYPNLFSSIVPLLGTVTISNGADATISLSNHGIFTGESFYLTTMGNLPNPLSINTLYYAIRVDSNTIRIASTYANALAGTTITTTTAGSGSHSFYYCPFGFSSSTDFKVPDLIGATTRMRGTSTGYIQNVTASMGSKQDDASQDHKHTDSGHSHSDLGHGHSVSLYQGAFNGGVYAIMENGGLAYGRWVSDLISFGTGYASIQSNNAVIGGPITNTQGTPRTGNETRMKNVGINKFIKF